jgi:hypothetical protein
MDLTDKWTGPTWTKIVRATIIKYLGLVPNYDRRPYDRDRWCATTVAYILKNQTKNFADVRTTILKYPDLRNAKNYVTVNYVNRFT